MAFWTSVLALVTSVIDDPGATVVYEVGRLNHNQKCSNSRVFAQAWSLGAIAISAISLPGLVIYHTEDFWLQLASAAKEGGRPATKDAKSAKVADIAATPAQTGKIAAIGFHAGLPKSISSRRSSAAEKLRSRSKLARHALNARSCPAASIPLAPAPTRNASVFRLKSAAASDSAKFAANRMAEPTHGVIALHFGVLAGSCRRQGRRSDY
ncbi:hypothetical protein GQ600_17919 [Phytophthora cactorum]|nr:hypothetical protein GQ600_17919 [Phytophthora cactorum]